MIFATFCYSEINPNKEVWKHTIVYFSSRFSDIGSDILSDEDDDEIFGSGPSTKPKKSASKKPTSDGVSSSGGGGGGVRIEFHGDNVAEAIEDESEQKKRVESLEKDIEQVWPLTRTFFGIFYYQGSFWKGGFFYKHFWTKRTKNFTAPAAVNNSPL